MKTILAYFDPTWGFPASLERRRSCVGGTDFKPVIIRRKRAASRRYPAPARGAHFVARFSQCRSVRVVPREDGEGDVAPSLIRRRRPRLFYRFNRYLSAIIRGQRRSVAPIIQSSSSRMYKRREGRRRVCLVAEKSTWWILCEISRRACVFFVIRYSYISLHLLPLFEEADCENECHDIVDCYGDCRRRDDGKCRRSQVRQRQTDLRGAGLSAQRHSKGGNFMWVRLWYAYRAWQR